MGISSSRLSIVLFSFLISVKGKSRKPLALVTVAEASHHLLRDETEIGVNALLSIMRPEPGTRDVRAAD
ncbi:MAG: hypothetical protein J0L82_06515 [Deltaproteobacteria bacterium]|jgi:hypothetical protein|nr:hypothetical protein [Deltaproteobacteria bacterium]